MHPKNSTLGGNECHRMCNPDGIVKNTSPPSQHWHQQQQQQQQQQLSAHTPHCISNFNIV
jgi:hypothetical protein